MWHFGTVDENKTQLDKRSWILKITACKNIKFCRHLIQTRQLFYEQIVWLYFHPCVSKSSLSTQILTKLYNDTDEKCWEESLSFTSHGRVICRRASFSSVLATSLLHPYAHKKSSLLLLWITFGNSCQFNFVFRHRTRNCIRHVTRENKYAAAESINERDSLPKSTHSLRIR